MNNTVNHLAIIMDGNKRWSKNNNINLEKGYLKGFEKIIDIANYCIKSNIEFLTLFALSSENRNRPSVDNIFNVLELQYKKLFKKIVQENNIKFKIIGEKTSLPLSILKILKDLELQTKNATKLKLNVAFNYGTNNEILTIVKNISKLNIKNVEDIDYKLIRQNMYLSDMPDFWSL